MWIKSQKQTHLRISKDNFGQVLKANGKPHPNSPHNKPKEKIPSIKNLGDVNLSQSSAKSLSNSEQEKDLKGSKAISTLDVLG